MPLTYERAYGGREPDPPRDPTGRGSSPAIRLGRGFRPGPAAPNVEYPGVSLTSRPAGFGPIPPHWQPRVRYAGTYDETWQRDRCPLYPDDLDDRFFLCSPEDQRPGEFLRGGEPVELLNLTPSGRLAFTLPRVAFGFETVFRGGDRVRHRGRLAHRHPGAGRAASDPGVADRTALPRPGTEAPADDRPAEAGAQRARGGEGEGPPMNPFGTTVVVVGVGARTAIGMTAPATAAAVRAGVAGFEKHPFVIDTAGNRMIVAAAPYLGLEFGGADRVAELAAPAAAEALTAFAAAPGGKPPVPIFIGLPPARPGRAKDLAHRGRRPGPRGGGGPVPRGEGRGDRDRACGRGDGGEGGVGGCPVRGRRVRAGRRGRLVPGAGNAGVAGGERPGPLGRAGEQPLRVHPRRGGRVRPARVRGRGRAVQAARGPRIADRRNAQGDEADQDRRGLYSAKG